MASKQDKINETFMEKLDSFGEKLNEAITKLEALPAQLTLELDKRYADKRTEKNVDKLVWLVFSSIILAGIAIILK